MSGAVRLNLTLRSEIDASVAELERAYAIFRKRSTTNPFSPASRLIEQALAEANRCIEELLATHRQRVGRKDADEMRWQLALRALPVDALRAALLRLTLDPTLSLESATGFTEG